MTLDRAWISAHIPHQGRMCLLDEVLAWDERRVRCRSATHRDPAHPLRAHGRLGVVCAIEYAAQAAAVHGALLSGVAQSQGYLAAARALSWRVPQLNHIEADLLIDAERIAADARVLLYDFSVRSGQEQLVQGRLTVVHD